MKSFVTTWFIIQQLILWTKTHAEKLRPEKLRHKTHAKFRSPSLELSNAFAPSPLKRCQKAAWSLGHFVAAWHGPHMFCGNTSGLPQQPESAGSVAAIVSHTRWRMRSVRVKFTFFPLYVAGMRRMHVAQTSSITCEWLSTVPSVTSKEGTKKRLQHKILRDVTTFKLPTQPE